MKCRNKYFPTYLSISEYKISCKFDNCQIRMLIQKKSFSCYQILKKKLSSISVNTTCVLKFALKMRRKIIVNMKINEKQFSLISSNNLYSAYPKKAKSHLILYAANVNDISLFSLVYNL